jgi:DNA-binding NtrC family response regulator
VRALREYGYTALEAQDVDAARRHLDHPGLALVLADVITRGGSLDELTADIARRRPGLPILLMTGYSEALSQRAVDPSRLLRKPFTPTDLLTRIRALLAEAARQG